MTKIELEEALQTTRCPKIEYEWNGPDDTNPVLVMEREIADLTHESYVSEFGNVDEYLLERNPLNALGCTAVGICGGCDYCGEYVPD